MNLKKKKKLMVRILKVGLRRIKLASGMREEIKEAITRQDIRDLRKGGIIRIKEKKGRRKKEKKKTRIREGSRKKKVKRRKQDYVKLTRKIRAYLKNLKEKGDISSELYKSLRKKTRTKEFRNLAHLREALRKVEK
jgi:large subunit ribosomal protein L19e